MAIELIAKIKPKGGGNFPMVDASDVEMPDGTRLSEFNPEVNLTEEQLAALKGEKGDKGDPGKTPVRGTDYWTDADKQEIKGYVDSLFVPISQEAYDLLVSNGTVDANKYYMIVGDSA